MQYQSSMISSPLLIKRNEGFASQRLVFCRDGLHARVRHLKPLALCVAHNGNVVSTAQRFAAFVHHNSTQAVRC